MCGVVSAAGVARMKVRHERRREVREVAVAGLKVFEASGERSRVRQRSGSEARWYHCAMLVGADGEDGAGDGYFAAAGGGLDEVVRCEVGENPEDYFGGQVLELDIGAQTGVEEQRY